MTSGGLRDGEKYVDRSGRREEEDNGLKDMGEKQWEEDKRSREENRSGRTRAGCDSGIGKVEKRQVESRELIGK